MKLSTEMVDQLLSSRKGKGGAGADDKLTPDGEYVKVEFGSKEKHEKFEGWLQGQLSRVVRVYRNEVHPKMRKNRETYEGKSDKEDVITIPLCKRDTNQQHAWHVETILSKDPLVTVTPLEPGKIPAIVMGPMGPEQYEFTTEEYANGFEHLLQYDLTHLVKFDELVDETVMSILQDGNAPDWWKVYYERKESTVRERLPKLNEVGLPVFDDEGNYELEYVDASRDRKSDVHIERLNPFRVYRPLTPQCEQTCDFLAEHLDIDALDVLGRIQNKEYDFAGQKADDDTKRRIIFGTSDEEAEAHENIAQPEDDEAKEANPQVFEVWLDYPLQIEGKTRKTALCAHFCLATGRVLKLYENFYEPKERPYLPFFMRKRADEWSSSSTVEDVAPFQRLISSIFHQQLANLSIQNMKLFFVREGSSAWKWVQKGGKLKPGAFIPFSDPNDISPQALGTAISSMAGEINYLTAEAEKLTVVSQFDRGEIPNRTPAGTVAQINELSKLQPAVVLRRIRRQIGKALRMYMQRRQQFSDYGVVIPFRDPKQRALAEELMNGSDEQPSADGRLIAFPNRTLMDDFAFELTATAEDESEEAAFERNMVLYREIQQNNMANAELVQQLLAPPSAVPPPVKKVISSLLRRDQRALKLLFENQRKDMSDLVISQDLIDEALAELEMMFGGQNGQIPGAPGPGGSVPGGPVQPGGPAGFGAEPGMAGIPAAGPPANL